jgi:hypothetical protein
VSASSRRRPETSIAAPRSSCEVGSSAIRTGASWARPTAGIYGTGNVAFRWPAHSINLTAAEPEIEINGAASRAVFRFSGSGGTPYPNQRAALETLETAGLPTVSPDGRTLTYNLMRGRLTPDGEKVFAGFYPAPSDNEFGCISATFTLP